MNDFLKGATLFIGGAIVGAAAVMLLAPKAGEEARKKLADLAEQAKEQAAQCCEQKRKTPRKERKSEDGK